jgi:hypothetical protein
MRETAFLNFGEYLNRSLTYSNWDADKIYGCVCDSGFHGYDCSKRYCPMGDDPLTQTLVSNEVHTLICTCADTCSGTFTLSFKGYATAAIAYNAPQAVIKSRLEALPTIANDGITIGFSTGNVVCSSAGVTTTVTYTADPGDLPALSIASSLASTTGTPSMVMQTIQQLKCTCTGTCSGSIHLLYDDEITAAIAYSGDAAEVKSALEALADLSDVTVTTTGTA